MTKPLLRLTVVAGAASVAAVAYEVLHRWLGIDLAAHTGSTVQQIGVTAAAVAAAVAALAGWLLLSVLERLTARSRAIWTVIAVVVLLLSLVAGPAAAVSAEAIAGLAMLHLAVGAVVIAGMRWSDR